MTQFPSLEKIRPYLRIETAVVVALLVVVVFWYMLSQQVNESSDAEGVLDQKIAAVRSDINAFTQNDERATLQAQLAELQADQTTVVLPSRDLALQFGDVLLKYVSSQNIPLNNYATEETLTPIGEQDYPTILYIIIVQGPQNSLVGTLELLQEFPTAAVQVLELIRPVEDRPEWVMTLELSVFYDDGSTQVGQ